VFLSNRIAGHVEILFLVPVIILLAVPAGALAAVSLSSGYGTPTIVIAMLTAPRVYRFLFTLLKSHLKADHLFYARSLGVGPMRLLLAHLAPCIAPELLALLGTTLVMAIGIMVPVEVIFDLNGVGQLAWTAALNRDAPVIAATTLVAAGAVAIAGVLTDSVLFERLWRNRRRSSECVVPQEAQ
jgi:peptide/nickel transport system permease protein